ncbi:MAG: S41 family peptidase [Bacteroidetes bacterium]|jgi:carboxyl-terminal processing protease|nr:S41 family peptidase [Bacteroidota bacterium]
MTRRYFFLSGVAVFATLLFVAAQDGELFFRINRSIDLFGKVYREIVLQHVDDVDPDHLMRRGINGMLEGLDPYTVFIDDKESDELELVTTGRYGGIGISIGMRDGEVVIVNLLEGFSASKQGLQVGDRLLEVEGTAVSKLKPEEIRRLVRGAPGTEVRLKIAREGDAAPLEFVLLREDIRVRNISFSGLVEPGIGYIRLERFSRTAGEDVRSAMKGLKSSGSLKGVVLDLRDNPGGLLDIAVDVVSAFVPESSLVVSTKGRRRETERRYVTDQAPLVPDLPVAILVNGNSASASEIVAGAVQDLDRGVVVGTRTFGKGLVQTVSRLTETASLKITTARYYTPSGRSIQLLDYAHRSADGKASTIPDSLRRTFKTKNGRSVSEGGGISPDSAVAELPVGPFVAALARKAVYFKFVTSMAARGRLDSTTRVTDRLMADFERYLDSTGFQYEEEAAEALRELRSIAADSRYQPSFVAQLETLEKLAAAEKRRSFERYRDEVWRGLHMELAARWQGERGRIQASLEGDRQLGVAVGLLKQPSSYGRRLAR